MDEYFNESAAEVETETPVELIQTAVVETAKKLKLTSKNVLLAGAAIIMLLISGYIIYVSTKRGEHSHDASDATGP
jgi:cell division protein FtsL